MKVNGGLSAPGGPPRRNSPLELEEVVFGLRCSLEVKFAVVRALKNRSRPVKFYEIRERREKFPLDQNAFSTQTSFAYRCLVVRAMRRRILESLDEDA